MKSRKPGATLSARGAARSNSGRQPSTDSGFLRNIGKSRPARCILASASPTPVQCAALGRRGHTPSRKLMIAAGRPASSAVDLALAIPGRLRATHAALGQMRHQRQEVRQIVHRHALFIEREDVGALAGVQQEVGILDALGDALVGEQFADVVAFEEFREVFGGDVGVNRHGRTSGGVGSQRTRQREELVLFRGRDRLHMQLDSARRRRP